MSLEQRETTAESLRGTGCGTCKKRTRDKRKRRGARLIRSRFHERERERNGFYVGAPSLRQFGAHTKRWPPVIQKFAGYGGTFTNDEGNFISSVYLSGNLRDTVRERVFCIRATLYRLILNADNIISMCNWASCHSITYFNIINILI